jgi:hypothetical protein
MKPVIKDALDAKVVQFMQEHLRLDKQGNAFMTQDGRLVTKDGEWEWTLKELLRQFALWSNT